MNVGSNILINDGSLTCSNVYAHYINVCHLEFPNDFCANVSTNTALAEFNNNIISTLAGTEENTLDLTPSRTPIFNKSRRSSDTSFDAI